MLIKTVKAVFAMIFPRLLLSAKAWAVNLQGFFQLTGINLKTRIPSALNEKAVFAVFGKMVIGNTDVSN